MKLFRLFHIHVVFQCSGVIRVVSPEAATDGVALFFLPKKLTTF